MKEHQVKLKILKELSQGGFHSGEELGQALGISRAAVSKHIQGIQQWGVDIFRIQGKGYQLAKPLQLLDESVLKQTLSAPLELIPIIDSTNQYLMDQLPELQSGSVCVSEYQAKGRGRRGRQWVSPFGANLYLSMYWRLDAGMAAAMGLSLVVGVAIVEALESLGIDGVKLKWPNDLYYDDKKLAGILVEMSGQAGGAAHLVIGMGMNLAMSDTVEGIDQPWTSLSHATSKTIDRNQLVIAFIQAWQNALLDYEMMGLTGFVERWNRHDNFVGRQVKLLMGHRDVEGTLRGIDAQGAVLIETDQGVQAFIGGEISLRKV
ncbi:bifunctional biotin--[acetyl-CoA-carboxylase] ligase/biotin operon repressor BirA [Vibrio sp. ZSDZ34]|jgi:BirA family biotin operon repressor/biotin-[acetyl-CoA-carboxylase] ligase|uniref:Bifunctional ligase/repressor BirA n=1 Tax=Vibrio gelatinilyticus TaxID=2893468 RepID=A0A9X2AXW9_9VIBR|nr:bifunctional biotin--[acetyl-CoA-carboxylase] ligase/biotin operon repressor BirA [Vibrio gelatinilyticus]MCJ2378850.1 bifunctional biotin--[acetyl-CoA-carboxylase] ligase/biotin operon repressor BirA [Vibrio gelatinilyticus]